MDDYEISDICGVEPSSIKLGYMVSEDISDGVEIDRITMHFVADDETNVYVIPAGNLRLIIGELEAFADHIGQ